MHFAVKTALALLAPTRPSLGFQLSPPQQPVQEWIESPTFPASWHPSHLLINAESKSSFRFVAPITMVRLSCTNPSMCRNSTPSIRRVASCMSPLRLVASESISSRNSRHPPRRSQASRMPANFCSLSPYLTPPGHGGCVCVLSLGFRQ